MRAAPTERRIPLVQRSMQAVQAAPWWVRELVLGAVLAIGVPLILRTAFAAELATRKSFGGVGLMVLGLLLVAGGLYLYAWWLSSLRELAQRAQAGAEHEPEAHFDLGPYAFTRNPSRLALLALALAQPLWQASAWLAGYALLLAIGLHAWVVLRVEPALQARHGQAYAAWSRSVPRWLPWRSLAQEGREVAETAWRLIRRR